MDKKRAVLIGVVLVILGGGLVPLGYRPVIILLVGLVSLGLLLVCLHLRDALPALILLVAVSPLDRIASIATNSGSGDELVATFIPLVGLGAAGTWFAVVTLTRQRIRVFRELWWLAAFAGTALVSSLAGVDPETSLQKSITYAQLLVFTFLVVNIVTTTPKYEAVVWTIITVQGVLAVIVIVQVVLGQAPLLGGVVRAVGARGDPNFNAQQLLVALPFAALMLPGTKAFGQRGFLLAVGGAIVVAVLLTISLGGVVGLVTTVTLILLYYARDSLSRWVKGILWVFGLAIIAFYAMPLPLWDRAATQLDLLSRVIHGGADPLNLGTYRVAAWAAALRVWQLRPVLGVGPGNVEALIVQYNPVHLPYFDMSRLGPHNIFLSLTDELGIVGLSIFVLLLSGSFYRLLQSLRAEQAAQLPERRIYAGYATLISIAVFLVQSLGLDSQTSKALWLLIGMSIAHSLIVKEQLAQEKSRVDGASVL